MTYPDLINIIPNTFVDDFFFFGFAAGMVGYAWYWFTNRDDKKNHVSVVAGFYGVFLSGCVGGLLAIVFDRNIGLSILIGLLNQLIYMGMLKAAKNGDLAGVFKELLIRYLGGVPK